MGDRIKFVVGDIVHKNWMTLWLLDENADVSVAVKDGEYMTRELDDESADE